MTFGIRRCQLRRFCRYKAAGANATDATGALDTVEFINISKDDVLAWPGHAHRTYPPTVNARMTNTIAPFVRKSLAINETILNIFNAKLGLPEGALANLHIREEYSGSEARCIKNPPKPETSPSDIKAAIGAHTDFGSLVCFGLFAVLNVGSRSGPGPVVVLTQPTGRLTSTAS